MKDPFAPMGEYKKALMDYTETEELFPSCKGAVA